MSHFSRNICYIIIPTTDITTAMMNYAKHSFSVHGDKDNNSLRKTNDGSSVLLKVAIGSDSDYLFENYQWHNKNEIEVIINNPDGDWVNVGQ